MQGVFDITLSHYSSQSTSSKPGDLEDQSATRGFWLNDNWNLLRRSHPHPSTSPPHLRNRIVPCTPTDHLPTSTPDRPHSQGVVAIATDLCLRILTRITYIIIHIIGSKSGTPQWTQSKPARCGQRVMGRTRRHEAHLLTRAHALKVSPVAATASAPRGNRIPILDNHIHPRHGVVPRALC